MLTIDFNYFRSNPDLLLEEIINRSEEGFIEFNGLGCFKVVYIPAKAANDSSIGDVEEID